MTDFQLPVLRHLTADEVEPGMTIAGKIGKSVKIGIADRNASGYWYTATGESLGGSRHGYDLLAEAPKPPITLPQEFGVVIRYTADGETEIAHRTRVYSKRPWLVDGADESFSDDDILASGACDGYEVAVWTKPGDQ